MTVEARWNGAVIARSDRTEMVEGNHYFPRPDVREDLLADSDKTTFCPWKGTATYHSIEVDGKLNADAAWTYREPKDKAAHIKDHLAFWNGVEIVEI